MAIQRQFVRVRRSFLPLGHHEEACGDIISWVVSSTCMPKTNKAVYQNCVPGATLSGLRSNGIDDVVTKLQLSLRNLRDNSISVSSVEGSSLKGKEIAEIHKVLVSSAVAALRNPPALCIFKDFELMASQDTDGSSKETRALSRFLVRLFCKNSRLVADYLIPTAAWDKVAVLFVVPNENNVPSSIRQALVSKTFEICPFSEEDKQMMLTSLLQDEGFHIELSALHDLRLSLDVYSKSDITTLADGLMNSCHQNKTMAIDRDSLSEAFTNVKPAVLQATHQSESNLTWADIGGLNNVKSVVTEVFENPIKYKEIFKKSPIRLPTGVLLFGPPGCGKTLVARVIANSSSLPLISVKGPELLNKYIGASEEAVRTLFSRARAVAPSIIFFDELEAIAPKRGADNTGVTDRVVNQLLTELDGVEGRGGVYVLAASSRPDLIDAALLRPGRLDKAVSCPMPSDEDRSRILAVLLRRYKMDSDVDLKVVASSTAGLSGADLKGLCSTAYLSAVNRVVSAREQKNSSKENTSSADVDLTKSYSVSLHTSEEGPHSASELEVAQLRAEIAMTQARPATAKGAHELPSVVVTQNDLLLASAKARPSVSEAVQQKHRGLILKFERGVALADPPTESIQTLK